MWEVPPCLVSDLTSFVSNVNRPDEDSENSIGSISRDGTWSWIAHGSLLEVFSVQTKDRCAAHCFGAKLKNSSISITATKEFSSPHLSFPCLLVGLDSCDGGLLCVVNVKISKVITAIQLPYKVTSLEVISSVGGATMETYTLSSQLRYMFGIVAVGTEGGNVFLVDLCLDAENYSNEAFPNNSAIVSKTVQGLTSKREAANANNQHISIFLNDNNFNCDTFEYRNGSKLLANFSPGDVIVSALKYIRNLAVLVVGFNFGGIQLWNLQHLRLEISIPIPVSQQPLVHFAFQEPENDPRNFCYIWAISGHYQGENYRPESTSVATLYSLSYSKKEWIPRYGYFYQVLQSCTKRFEYALSNDPYNPVLTSMHCSRLIACDVVSQADLLSKLDIDDPLQNGEWNSSDDLSLCLMAWENWPTTGKKPSSSYLALFDINQWYQAQMPNLLRNNYREMCSYLGLFSLKEVLNKMDFMSLMAVSIVPNSMSPFKSSGIAEELFFPSSLSFRICCITTHGILQASYLGIQRQLLAEMNHIGPNILIDPKELYKRCVTCGLLNHANVTSPVKLTTVALQRESLLTLALEHSMVQFLSACVHNWKHTEFIHSGCSSKFMLDWVWKVVAQMKSSMDKLCLPLFNGSGQSLSENQLITLHNFKSRLKYLSDIISTFQNLAVPQTEQGQQELKLRRDVIDYIFTYLSVVLWLYDCKLLPEHPEGDEYGENEVAYPVTIFNRTYMYHRNELLQKDNWPIHEPEGLLVDGLVDEFGDSLSTMWVQKGGTKCYPPPSLYASVSSYLINEVPISQKHMLMYYLLLDMAEYLTDRQSHLLEKLSGFCSANSVSPSLSKLTQAFWYLDHRDSEAAMSVLMDPTVLSSDITSSQHIRIIRMLLHQEQPRKALKYLSIRTPPTDSLLAVKLHLSVLIKNRLIGDAFSFLREHEDDSNFEDLFAHLFFCCQQAHCLDSLLYLSLNVPESSALSEYLYKCKDPKAPELLVMFHLLRCQPLEASSLNEWFSQVMEKGTRCRERSLARNALVSGFLNALPEEQKKLAKELNQVHFTLAHKKESVNAMPLSATVTSKTLAHLSYADLLTHVMTKISNSVKTSASPQTPFRFRDRRMNSPFIRPAITPDSRKRKHSPDSTTPHVGNLIPSPEEQSGYLTPAKRSRSFNIRTFLLSDKNPRAFKTPLHESLLTLLQTPPVSRISSSAQASKFQCDSVAQTTPLSILKTKVISSGLPASPSQDQVYCKTPSVCSETSTVQEIFENEAEPCKKNEELHPRQLRFQEPSPVKSSQNTGYCRVSPRKPIREVEELVSVKAPILPDITEVSESVTLSAAEASATLEPPLLIESDVKIIDVASSETEDDSTASPLKEPVVENPEPIYYDVENFSFHYSDSISHTPSHCSNASSDLEVVYDSHNAPPNIGDDNSDEDCSSANMSFMSVEENNPHETTLKANDSPGKLCDPFFNEPDEAVVGSSNQLPDQMEYLAGATVESEMNGFSTPQKKEDSPEPYFIRTRARSKSVSPSRTINKDADVNVIPFSVTTLAPADSSVQFKNESSDADAGVIEMNYPVYVIPEDEESSSCQSARSKSASPSQSIGKDAVTNVIPQSVALFTAAEISMKSNKDLPEGGVPPEEAELPHPGSLTPVNEEVLIYEMPLYHQEVISESESHSPPTYTVLKSVEDFRCESPTTSALQQETGSNQIVPTVENNSPIPETTQEEAASSPKPPAVESVNLPPSPSRSEAEPSLSIDHAPDLNSHEGNIVETISSNEKLDGTCELAEATSSTHVSPSTNKTQRKMEVTYIVQEAMLEKSPKPTPQTVEVTPKTEVVDVKPKGTKKKRTVKPAKSSGAMKFNFSNPRTPASSEVLEVLYSSPREKATPEFIFSPPALRTRNRQKRHEEAFIASDVSVIETTTCGEELSKDKVISSTSGRKATKKLKKRSKNPSMSSPEKYINFISPVASTASPEKRNRLLSSTKHSMTLRKAKKSVKLF